MMELCPEGLLNMGRVTKGSRASQVCHKTNLVGLVMMKGAQIGIRKRCKDYQDAITGPLVTVVDFNWEALFGINGCKNWGCNRNRIIPRLRFDHYSVSSHTVVCSAVDELCLSGRIRLEYS